MISILGAPTNLGLRPPQDTSVPGCAKAPEALREAGLHRRLIALGAEDAGVVIAGRYVDDVTPGSGTVRNQAALVDHTIRLADRIAGIVNAGRSPLIVGGDCSVLVATGVALARKGRYGLVHIDGHTDFRHPGNSARWGSAAGEDLAAAVGLHVPELSDMDQLGPYFAPEDVVHVGCRENDEHREEAQDLLGAVIPASRVISDPARSITAIRDVVTADGLAGYWLHIDIDVLDPSFMPAVDSPDPGGLEPQQLKALLSALAPDAVGAAVCIYDPDLDPDGRYAELLTDVAVESLSELGSH